MKARCLFLVFGAGSLALTTAARSSLPSPEQQTLELSRRLRPMSDERWSEVTGKLGLGKEQLDQAYEITRGDTLWGISKRLFGDPNYWPKIWALNGVSIPNPHWIRPGGKLVFLPGSSTSLPALAMGEGVGAQATASDGSGGIYRGTVRSQEWRNLPPQGWEEIQLSLPVEIDPQGIDSRTRYEIPKASGFDMTQLASTQELPVLARVSGSGRDGRNLVEGETVFLEVKGEAGIETGKVLTVTREPTTLGASLFSRKGLAYPVDGQIEVIGQKNGTWLGRITRSFGVIERGSSILVDFPIRYDLPAAVPAPGPIEATLLVDREAQTSFISQHHLAFIDRGSEDGVAPGMVFRSFQYEDPSTTRELSKEDILHSGDVLVLHSTERFSTVLVTASMDALADGARLKALTQVESTGQPVPEFTPPAEAPPAEAPPAEAPPAETPPAEAPPAEAPPAEAPPQEEVAPEPAQTNELDQLEGNNELSEEEQKNLQQLEQNQEAPAATAPVEGPVSEPAPEGEAPPSI